MLTTRAVALSACLVFAAPASGQFGPYVEEAEVSEPAPSLDNGFGRKVAVSGETLVVGGWNAAYVYVRAGGEWTFQDELTVPGAIAVYGVAISAATALVGGLATTTGQGVVWVFVRTGNTWALDQVITDPTGPDDDPTGSAFGYVLALSGNTAVIGAPNDDVVPGGTWDQAQRGSAFVYVNDGSGWTKQAELLAPDAQDSDEFGGTVAISADTVVVGRVAGAYNDHQHAAYVFSRDGTTWSYDATLTEPASTSLDSSFALSVGVSGTTVLCANPMGAQVFEQANGSWALQATLVLPPPGGGRAVAIDGDLAILGVNDISPLAGQAYAFTRDGTTWTLHAALVPDSSALGDNFGQSAAVDGDTVVVGKGDGYGHAVVFRIQSVGSWEQLGLGLAGTSGMPTLSGVGYLQPSSPVTLALGQAKPFALAPLVVGFSLLEAPFKGGTMAPDPHFIFPAFTDAVGAVVFGGTWPDGVPAGFAAFFQWWVQDSAGPKGFAASNALAGTAP